MRQIDKAKNQKSGRIGNSVHKQGGRKRTRWAVKNYVKHATLRRVVEDALRLLRSTSPAPARLGLHVFEVDLPPGSTWDGDPGAIYFSAENLEARCGLDTDLWAEEVTSALGRWLDTLGGNHGPDGSA
jgi:hypothetical protein